MRAGQRLCAVCCEWRRNIEFTPRPWCGSGEVMHDLCEICQDHEMRRAGGELRQYFSGEWLRKMAAAA